MSVSNPAQSLYQYLCELYPPNMDKGTIGQIDKDFNADGSMIEFAYESHITGLLRRLVKTASYIASIYPREEYGDATRRSRIHAHLLKRTNLDKKKIEKITSLLIQCLDAKEMSISKGTRRYLTKSKSTMLCYYCGKDADDDGTDGGESGKKYTLDHIWPRALGGTSDVENLVISCSICNERLKGEHVCSPDYHYELIALDCTNTKEYLERRQAWFDMAIRAKSEFKCFSCEKPAQNTGELRISRIDSDDAYHFLNLAAYCLDCLPLDKTVN